MSINSERFAHVEAFLRAPKAWEDSNRIHFLRIMRDLADDASETTVDREKAAQLTKRLEGLQKPERPMGLCAAAQ